MHVASYLLKLSTDYVSLSGCGHTCPGNPKELCNWLSQWVYTRRICLIILYFQRQEIATISKYRLSLI